MQSKLRNTKAHYHGTFVVFLCERGDRQSLLITFHHTFLLRTRKFSSRGLSFAKSKKSGNLACLQPKQLCGSEEQIHPVSIIFQPTLVTGQKHILSKNLFPPLISVLLLNISPLENTSHFFSKVTFELGSDISFLLTSSCLFAAN